MQVVLDLRAAFAFPLSDTLTFLGFFAEVSALHIRGKLLCCEFAFLFLVVAFSQEPVGIWDFLVLGFWLTLSDRIFAITVSSRVIQAAFRQLCVQPLTVERFFWFLSSSRNTDIY